MEMKSRRCSWKASFIVSLSLFASVVFADPISHSSPKITIIIDNLGNQKQAGLDVAHLPGAVGCSILPHTQFSTLLADECHQLHKVVILNTPMQALKPFKLGPGGLYQGMGQTQFLATLNSDLQAVPYVAGLDNHMGSSLTTSTREMTWLVQAIKPHGLFFLDNRTSPHSVITRVAQKNAVPVIGRDIFLDDVRTPAAIHKQFNEALKIAKRYGSVVIVAHPDSATLKFLGEALPHLAAQGYQLVPVTELLPYQAQQVAMVPISAQAAKPEKSVHVARKSLINKSVAHAHTTHTVAKPIIITQAEITAVVNSSPPLNVVPTPPPTVSQPSALHKMLLALKAKWSSAPTVETKIIELPKLTVQNTQINKPVIIQPKAPPPVTPTKLVVNLQKHGEKTKPELEKTLLGFNHEHKVNSTKLPVNPHASVLPQASEETVEAKAVTLSKPTQLAVQSVTTAAPVSIKPGLLVRIHSKLCGIYPSGCIPEAKIADKTSATVAAAPPEPPFDSLQGKLPWPTAGNILIHYGAQTERGGLRYTGVLIKAPLGQPVYAIYPGRVVFANWLQGFGLLLIIDHGDGYMSLYGHNQILYKKVGDMVQPKEVIATIGNSGRHMPTGLYFEIRHNSEPINPQEWCAIGINDLKAKVG